MLDILIALIFAGCIYGIARAWGRRPNYPRVAGWTGAAMFAIAAWVPYRSFTRRLTFVVQICLLKSRESRSQVFVHRKPLFPLGA